MLGDGQLVEMMTNVLNVKKTTQWLEFNWVLSLFVFLLMELLALKLKCIPVATRSTRSLINGAFGDIS